MEPLKVVGWEKRTGKKGGVGYYIYCERSVQRNAEGFMEGDGCEAVRLYVNPEYCKYEPQVGHVIIPVEGRFGIDQVYVVNGNA